MNGSDNCVDSRQDRIKVSIVVKALNEGRNIARTLDSIHSAARGLSSEVILADSCSTDETVEIALSKGAIVWQLASPQERCCGVGAQLGYQSAKGEFILLIDGDMELVPGFVESALEAFAVDPRLGGVGGQIIEMTVDNRVFVNRMQNNLSLTTVGEVEKLDMGGMYRTSALRGVGYFTHPGFHACEEMELGCRLRAKGWTLKRLEQPAVRHYGHTLPRYRLLRRRITSGYFFGPGEFVRASWGKPWFSSALRTHKAYLTMLAFWAAFLLSLAIVPWSLWPLAMVGAGFVGLFALAIMKRRNLGDGVYSLVAWNVYACGLLIGAARRLRDPEKPVAAVRLDA